MLLAHPQLLSHLVEFLLQLCARLLALRQLGFQLAPQLGALGSFDFALQGALGLFVSSQRGFDLVAIPGMFGRFPF